MNHDARPWLVLDVEATCCDAGEFPRDEMEIIEIGAVLCDARTLEPSKEFQTFVKPRRHPRLTEFCSKLTTIAQSDVDRAPDFPRALAALRDFLAGGAGRFASWGDYDWWQFKRDALLHRATLPFVSPRYNLKEMFSTRAGDRAGYGTGQALRRVGLAPSGTHHRAIDDARNIARLLPWCTGAAPVPAGDARRRR